MSPWSLDLLSADSSFLSVTSPLTPLHKTLISFQFVISYVDYSFLSYVVFKVLAGFTQQLFLLKSAELQLKLGSFCFSAFLG